MPSRGVPLDTYQGCTLAVFQGWFFKPQNEESYDFEIWHVVLSYQKDMIGTFNEILIPPLHPPL